MYVRIARFEGIEGLDGRIDEVRGRMAAGLREDEVPVKRALMLVDRTNGRGANLMFCETEDDLRTVDEYMNNVTPERGGASRTSVELYEVAVDSDDL